MVQIEYYIRRLIVSVLLIFAIATFLFFAFRLMPGDYASLIAGEGADPDTMDELRASWGLDRPLHVQYYHFITNMATGDAGTSHVSREPVVSYVAPRLANSLILVLPGIVTAFVLGSLYGALMGTSVGSWLEQYGLFPPTIIGTTPQFFIGILVLFVFSQVVGIFPSGGMVSRDTYLVIDSHWEIYLTRDFWYHFTLPFLTVVLAFLYYPALVMRGSVVEVRGQEFINYQKMLGMGKRRRFRHIVKHASLPVITLLPTLSATSISGLVLIEVVFNWPGIGLLVFSSVLARDTPVIQFVFLIIAIWIVVGNFIVDILYTVIDPRITYDATE